MPKVTYISVTGEEQVVDVPNGENLMQAALDNSVPNILGDCGGECACATCHVYVEGDWFEKAGKPSELEADMLEGLLEFQENSRLCCQIKMSDDLDGLVVTVPEAAF